MKRDRMKPAWFLSFVIALFACTGGGKGGFPDGGLSGGDGGSGRVCGGLANVPCGSNEFCDFARNQCGGADETGSCRERPGACRDNFDPVCGCDGRAHSNECDAAASGNDVNAFGSCELGPDRFACGFRACELRSTYCQRVTSDIGGEPDGFACMPLPASCAAAGPDCACLANEPCGSACTGTAAEGLTLRCSGG